MLEYSDPGVVLVTETLLNPTIAELKVLAENYRFVARKDRPNSTLSGAARQEMESTEVDTNSTAEFVAAGFNATYTKKPVIIGCLYRPTDNSKHIVRNFVVP